MRDMSDEELSNMTTPFSKTEYIEVKDFVKLEKMQKGVLYIVHRGAEESEVKENG